MYELSGARIQVTLGDTRQVETQLNTLIERLNNRTINLGINTTEIQRQINTLAQQLNTAMGQINNNNQVNRNNQNLVRGYRETNAQIRQMVEERRALLQQQTGNQTDVRYNYSTRQDGSIERITSATIRYTDAMGRARQMVYGLAEAERTLLSNGRTRQMYTFQQISGADIENMQRYSNAMTRLTDNAEKFRNTMMTKLQGMAIGKEGVADLQQYQDLLTRITTLDTTTNQETLRNQINLIVDAYNRLRNVVRETYTEQSRTDTIRNVQDRYIEKINQMINANTRLANDPSILALRQRLNELNNVRTDRLQQEIAEIGTEFQRINNQARQTQSTMSGLGRAFNTFFPFATTTALIYKFYAGLRSGFSTIVELDSAMTDLKKVTDETSDTYERFGDVATQTAMKLGNSTKGFTEAVTSWSKIGFDLRQATELANTSLIYSNVGDMSAEESAKSLVSTIQAFKVESKDAISVVDKFNEVGNNFAVTSKGIGDALYRSASALANANNTIDESIALIASGKYIAVL